MTIYADWAKAACTCLRWASAPCSDDKARRRFSDANFGTVGTLKAVAEAHDAAHAQVALA